MSDRMRLKSGQFAPKHCSDPHCGGEFVADVERQPWGDRHVIRCDGLTYRDESGPLVACPIQYEALP